jgi:hypothetical protein
MSNFPTLFLSSHVSVTTSEEKVFTFKGSYDYMEFIWVTQDSFSFQGLLYS